MSTKEENNLKIGSQALVAIKKQNKAVEIFKKPQPLQQKKKSKHVILTEEKYLSVSFNRFKTF